LNKSGITRRIDELGRIVIPKEMRINLGIREGEPLEISVDNKVILIKKYSQVENIKDVSQKICNVISDICNIDLLISDREKVIVASSNLKKLINEPLNNLMKNLIDQRESYVGMQKELLFGKNKYLVMFPIITSTDSSGLIIVCSDNNNAENLIYAKLTSKLIANNLDVA